MKSCLVLGFEGYWIMFHAFKVSLHCSFFFPIKFGGCLIWFDLGFLRFFCWCGM